MKRKAQFLDKAKKDRLWGANGLLRCFCKGWGASAKQGGMDLQGCGQIAKVGMNRKGWVGFAKDIYVRGKVGQERKRTAEAALMRSKHISL